MNKALIGLLACVSLGTNAHSQLPANIKEYVVQPTNKFEITLNNGYSTVMTYDIFEDGKPSLQLPITLQPGESRVINAWVHTPPDEFAYKQICTSPRLKGNVKVKMCSRIVTYYPYSSLAQ